MSPIKAFTCIFSFILLCFALSDGQTLVPLSLRVLGSDRDEGRDAVHLINSRGFIGEAHYVTTSDGYILTIHRIINPLNKTPNPKPVLLQHGLLSSGIDFIVNSPGGSIEEDVASGAVGNNLGFELSKRGYDVWLTNSRGNTYGRNHTRMNPNKDNEFWEFTYDEMITYDLPETINYVLKKTGHATVGYVGHSQGTLIMFGLLSSRPEYNEIVKPFIALAPVTTVKYIKSPIHYLAHNSLLLDFFYWKGGQFLPSTKLLQFLGDKFCPKVFTAVCSNVVFLMAGFDEPQFNMTRMPVYFAHTPAGTSAWNFIHFAQGVTSGKFQKFDFGRAGNRDRYGTVTPPEYPLEKITSPNIALLTSVNDWLAAPQDVQMLRQRLRVPLLDDYVVPFERWNHLDFIWGIEAGRYVNSRVIDTLAKF